MPKITQRWREQRGDSEPRYVSWTIVLIAGILYGVNEQFTLSLGVKGGLSRAEMDDSLLPGVTSLF